MVHWFLFLFLGSAFTPQTGAALFHPSLSKVVPRVFASLGLTSRRIPGSRTPLASRTRVLKPFERLQGFLALGVSGERGGPALSRFLVEGWIPVLDQLLFEPAASPSV